MHDIICRPVTRVAVITNRMTFQTIKNFILDIVDLISQLIPPIFSSYRYTFSSSHLDEVTSYIDILTYNVAFSTAFHPMRANKVIEAIAVSNADVLCLQETNETWKALLLCKFRAEYPYFHFSHPTQHQAASGCAFLSRHPLKDISVVNSTEIVEGSVFPQLVCTVEDTRLGYGVKIANLHLRPPLNLDGTAHLETARTTGQVRLAEVRNIVHAHHGLEILAGDFNEQDGAHALSYLVDSMATNGMRDAVADYVPSHKETHRWPFFFGTTLHKRLDHIVYQTLKLKCVGCGVIPGFESGASDLQPVLARFAPGRVR